MHDMIWYDMIWYDMICMQSSNTSSKNWQTVTVCSTISTCKSSVMLRWKLGQALSHVIQLNTGQRCLTHAWRMLEVRGVNCSQWSSIQIDINLNSPSCITERHWTFIWWGAHIRVPTHGIPRPTPVTSCIYTKGEVKNLAQCYVFKQKPSRWTLCRTSM